MSVDITAGGADDTERQTRLVNAMLLAGGDESKLPESVRDTLSKARYTVPKVGSGASIMFIGDSITEGNSGSNAYSRIMGNLFTLADRVRALDGYNQGLGANTSQDVIDRLPSIGAVMADIADIQIGTTDINYNIGTEIFINNIRKIVAACLDYGAKCVVIHAIPLKSANGATPWNSAQISLRDSYNAAISALTMDNLIIDTDSPDVITDPDNMYSDGTHLSWWGSYVFGAAQAQATLRGLQKLAPATGYRSDNLLSNPALTGTAGTKGGVVTGDVADGWRAASNYAGVDVVCSKSENMFDDFTYAQTFTLSGVSENTSGVSNLSQDIPIAAQAGDTYFVMVRFKIEAGHNGLTNLVAQASADFKSESDNKYFTPITTTNELTGYLCTTVRSVLDGDETVLPVQFNIRVNNSAVNAVVHFDKPVVRKM